MSKGPQPWVLCRKRGAYAEIEGCRSDFQGVLSGFIISFLSFWARFWLICSIGRTSEEAPSTSPVIVHTAVGDVVLWAQAGPPRLPCWLLELGLREGEDVQVGSNRL